MSFCFLYNIVLENHSVQNSPWGEGGLLPAQGLFTVVYITDSTASLQKKKDIFVMLKC